MKDLVLRELRESKEEYLSGEELSEKLGVSRTAIWKYIKQLKDLGYSIESFSKKGYKLVPVQDILNEYEIKYGLDTKIIGNRIEYFREIDSTNKYAKKVAYEGCEEGYLIVANSQTLGRGRLGRTWQSAENKGIWMSIVLKPQIAPQDIHIITLGASIAVSKAIKISTGIETGIKWPNDIILNQKKTCGILTEMNAEVERVNFIVLGIGINVNQDEQDFDEEIKDKATSLKINTLDKKIINRSDIIKEVLLQLEEIYFMIKEGKTSEIINMWKALSVTMGKKVRVESKEYVYIGKAVDVLGDGRLIIECDDGQMREVLSGEISVRGIMGYAP